ncbi:MAG TPA: M48 family metallopeptidase [Gemmatimonadaceae bacterium]|nr:M48 family metallopeptidase [Gemmatimonadaceae bacterium]
MNFFEAQDAARTRTRTLVVLFIAAVAAIIAAVYLLIHATFGPGLTGGIDPLLLAAVAGGTILLVAGGSTARTLQLRQGGSRVAELLGGRLVRSNTTDEHERRLVNVVEEMAIASGTPVPAIYVLDDERGINAFAAGYTLDDAAVAVTRGTLESLTRTELQGVIAHEFSHILNGDMRLNIRLIGLLYGILLLAIVGRGLLHVGRGGRRGRSGGDGKVALIGIGLVAVGYIGVFFGRLIQAAVSRQREYLADAAAVQFTRAPEGIAGALRKIGAVDGGSRIESHHAAEASHLFFANGVSRGFTSLMATHPPLTDRILRIDPSFEGRLADPVAPATEQEMAAASFMAGQAQPRPRVSGQPAASAAAGDALVASIGEPRAEHVAYAHHLLESLPEEVRAAAHDPSDARALLFALLILESDDRTYLSIIGSTGEGSLVVRATDLARLLRPFGPSVRLPVLDILLPALRTLPPEMRKVVYRVAQRLIASDDRVDVFELAVYHVLGRQLFDQQNAAASASTGIHSLAPLRAEVQLVLSAVAWFGAYDAGTAQAAFEEGVNSLPATVGAPTLVERSGIDLEEVDAALGRLRHGAPGVRRRVLEACARVVTHDGDIRVSEAEMLRAVAEALDCPMPPVMGSGRIPAYAQ